MKDDYKKQLYDNYATSFQNSTGKFDFISADKSLPCVNFYLRGWLPRDFSSEILDLGCGDGRLVYSLQRLGYKNVSGVDISQSQLDLARQVSSSLHNQDVIEFLQQTARTFDLIVVFDLIEHLEKMHLLEFLTACHKVLKPGGRIVFQTPNAASPFFGSVRYGDLTHELAVTPVLLGQLMSRAGFSAIRAREAPPVPYVYSLKSTLRYFAWKIISGLFSLVDIVETGSRGAAIYTRVFLISGVK
jgi:2-polyprenyl-3-methyl-5-hydroxy-6-metoxy-1,4-benzoquinol methylase